MNTQPSNSSTSAVSLYNLCSDIDIQVDAKFLDEFHELLEKHQTSQLATPEMSQLRNVEANFRRKLKTRIKNRKEKDEKESEHLELTTSLTEDENSAPIDDMEPTFSSEVDDIDESSQNINPELGEYWSVKNGSTQLFSVIVDLSPLSVMYFEPTVKGKSLCLNENIYPVFRQDLVKKVSLWWIDGSFFT